MATLTTTSILSPKLISLIRSADPKGQMYLRVANHERLELGMDPFNSSIAIDLAKETINSFGSPTAISPISASTGRVTGSYWYQVNGKQYGCSSVKALLLQSLTALAAADPYVLNKLSNIKNRTKRIVAKDKYDLFDNKHLADEYAEQLENGWWVGTNNNKQEVKKWLARAADLSPNAGFSASL